MNRDRSGCVGLTRTKSGNSLLQFLGSRNRERKHIDIVRVAMQHFMLLQRNLIYTGITRAKRLLVVVGQKKALGLAVRNDQSRKRYSGLLSSLKETGQ